RSPLPDGGAGRRGRISQVPEESGCAYALFSAPGRTDSPGLTTRSARPPLWPQRRLPRQGIFRGSMARLGHLLSTLRGRSCLRATHDALPPAGHSTGTGLVTRRIPLKGFGVASYITSPFLKLY